MGCWNVKGMPEALSQLTLSLFYGGYTFQVYGIFTAAVGFQVRAKALKWDIGNFIKIDAAMRVYYN